MEKEAIEDGAFHRLAMLLKAGYRVSHVEGTECIFLEHPAGRRFKQWKLMAYDQGTIVGADEMRLRSFDRDAFLEFVSTVPEP